MSRAKKSPASRKARKKVPVRETCSLAELNDKNSWTPPEASLWSGIPLRTLYRLLRDGAVPRLPTGEPQEQIFPNAHDGKRKRACFRYVIPRAAFIRWWESIGAASLNRAA
jgi:hypothetical protein